VGIIEKSLGDFGAYASRHRWRVLIVTALITLASLPFAFRALKNLDVNLFNQTSESLKRFKLVRELSEDFGGDILAAVVTIPDQPTPKQVEELKRFGDLLTAELAGVGTREEDRAELPPKVREALERAAPGPVEENDPATADPSPRVRFAHVGPLPEGERGFLRQVECRTGQGIEKALQKIARQQPHVILTPDDVTRLKKLFEPAALDARLNEIADELRELTPNSPEALLLYEDPLGLRDLGAKTLQERLAARKQGLAGKDPDGYFLSPDKTTLVILARAVLPATQLDFNRALMAAAQRAENRAIEAFRKTSPTLGTSLKGERYGSFAEAEPPAGAPGVLRVGFTGMPAVTVENELNLKFDMELNTATSLIAVLLLFLIGFRSIWLTWDVILVTSLAILWTIAVAGATAGKISLLGSAFTAVPVGLTTDYAIFVYNSYHTLRLEGLNSEEAMRQTLARSGPNVITAALIASLAFFGVGLSHLAGLAEFGILGGVSALIGCALMLTVLPALICRASTVRARTLPKPLSFGMPQLGRWMDRPGARAICIVAGILFLLATVAVIKFGPDPGPESVAGVRFDPELGNMRLLSSRAIPLRDRIAERFTFGLADIRVVVSGETEEAAFKAAEQVSERLKPYIDKRELSHGGSALDFVPSPARQLATIAALKSFDGEAAAHAFRAAVDKRFGPKGIAYFKPFLKRLQDFRLLTRDASVLTLATVMQGPLANLIAPVVKIAPEADASKRVRLLSSWFPSSTDKPASWYDEIAAKLESDPAVQMTAARMVGFELKNYALADVGLITLLVSIGVAISLLVAFRSVFNCALSLIPLVFAFVAMLAGVVFSQMMGWDFSLNFVNLIMFPLLLGSSIDYGVYMVGEARSNERPTISQLMEHTGVAIFYCMGTTLAGFGSFMTSSYTGLLSMGIASVYGYLGALFGGLVVLPAVLGYVRDYEAARGRLPVNPVLLDASAAHATQPEKILEEARGEQRK